MSFTLTTSDKAKAKSGVNLSTDVTAQMISDFSDQAEGRVVVETMMDWVTDYANVGADVKLILDDVTSSLMAIQMIGFDLGSYNSRAEAQTMLDFNDNTANRGLKVLKDLKNNKIEDIPA